MDIKRAIKLTKDLSEMFSGIVEIKEALMLIDNKDDVLTTLKRHKDLLQEGIDKKKIEFSTISNKINTDLKTLKEKHSKAMSKSDSELKTIKAEMQVFQEDFNKMKSNATNAAKEEARSILNKAKTELRGLDGQISLKSKTLQEMNEAISKLKNKFG